MSEKRGIGGKRFTDYGMSSLMRIKNMDENLPDLIAERAAEAALEECADALHVVPKPKRRIRSRKTDKVKVYAALTGQQSCLASVVAAMSTGSGCVFLKGETGSGKSRILSLVAEQLSASCTPQAMVVCEKKRYRVPYSVARSLLSSLCWSHKMSPTDVLHRVFTSRPHLGIFPSMGSYLGVDLSDLGLPTLTIAYDVQQRMLSEVFLAWAQEIVSCGKLSSLVFLVDNAEHCDPMWWSFLEVLLKSTRTYRLNVVCSASINYEISDSVVQSCKALTMQISMLSNEDAYSLILHELKELFTDVKMITQDLFDQLFFRAGGNPLFLTEICRLSVDTKHVECSDDGLCSLSSEQSAWALADSKLRDIIIDRFKKLPAQALQTLQEAAVLGFRLDLQLLRAVTMLPDSSSLDDALSELCSARVLLPSAESSSVFVFYNSLYQEVALHLLDSLDMSRGLELHRRVAVSLTDGDHKGTDWAVIGSHWMHVAENSRRNSEQSLNAAMSALVVLRKCANLMRQVELNQHSSMCVHCMLCMVKMLADHPDGAKLHLEALLQLSFSRKLFQLKGGVASHDICGQIEDLAPQMQALLQSITCQQQAEVIDAHGMQCVELATQHSWPLASVFASCALPITVNATQRLQLSFFTQSAMLISGNLEDCRRECEAGRQLWLAAGQPDVPAHLPASSAVLFCSTYFWPLYAIATADVDGFRLFDGMLATCNGNSKAVWQLVACVSQMVPYRIDATVLTLTNALEPYTTIELGRLLIRHVRLYFDAMKDADVARSYCEELETWANQRPTLTAYYSIIQTYIFIRNYEKARAMIDTWKQRADHKTEWRLFSECHRLEAQVIEAEATIADPHSRPFIEGTQVPSVIAVLTPAEIETMRSHVLDAYTLAKQQHERLLQCRAAVHYARLSLRFGRWEDDATLLSESLCGISAKAATVFEDVQQAISLSLAMGVPLASPPSSEPGSC